MGAEISLFKFGVGVAFCGSLWVSLRHWLGCLSESRPVSPFGPKVPPCQEKLLPVSDLMTWARLSAKAGPGSQRLRRY